MMGFWIQQFQRLAHALQGGHLCGLTGHRALAVQYTGPQGQSLTLILEGKTFCQHCGEGIVLQWAELRCLHCQRSRPARLVWGQVHPTHATCLACGQQAAQLKVLERPQVYQLHHALLRVLTEEAYLRQQHSPDTRPFATRPTAWVERALLPSA